MKRRNVFGSAYGQLGKNKQPPRDEPAMELRFRVSAIAALNSFAANYEEAFSSLFLDSGLWNEDAIIEGFRQNAKKLRNDILSHVATRLRPKKMLGRKTLQRGWYEIDFHVGTRLVIVYYSEDKKQNIRWVESISIDRKPIIF